MTRHKAIVIGAGIGGLTAAIALRRAGLDVEIYERATELRESGSGLGIMSNAVAALREIGIQGELERRGQAIDDFQIFDPHGRLIALTPLKQLHTELGITSVSIHRAALQRILLEAAGDGSIQLSAACERVEESPRGVRVRFSDGRTAEGDVVIGADGIHSAVRRQLHRVDPPRYAGYICWLATVPFTHARFVRGYTGHYWGKGQRFGLIDIGGGQVYWWATQNRKQRVAPLAAEEIKRDVQHCFTGWADEVMRAIEVTPAASIISLDCVDRPFLERWGRGRITLLGDAAHPMLTSLGQGAGMAIEDAVVLGRALAGSTDLVQSLRHYEDLRRDRTRQIVRLSRVMSMVEQLEHPVAVALRDTVFRMRSSKSLWEQTRPLLTFENPAVGV